MFRLYKTTQEIVIQHQDKLYRSPGQDWDALINSNDLWQWLETMMHNAVILGDASLLKQQPLVAPIGSQEVWAAGVTYLRSKTARMEESEKSGAAIFYDKVYDAPRPELFFKATAARVAGPGAPVRIRKDSTWNVPEPELTLVVTSSGKIVGYTIGNDMSSRSIEGENPLYLPQAKMYDGSAAIGPCVLVPKEPIQPTTTITMRIIREGIEAFGGSTTIDRMKRTHTELVEYLYREYSMPAGCYLMTGTCVVPDNDFTLQSGDRVVIDIDNIGTLENTVA